MDKYYTEQPRPRTILKKIQNAEESVAALAKPHNVNAKTVQK